MCQHLIMERIASPRILAKVYFVVLVILAIYSRTDGRRHYDYEPHTSEEELVEVLEPLDTMDPEISPGTDHHTIIILAQHENSVENGDPDITVPVSNPCQCEEELGQMRDRIDNLERQLRLYKESELERFYKLTRRIKYIVDSLMNSRPEDAQAQMNFLRDHIMEPDVLQRVSEAILTALASNPNFNSTILNSALPIVVPKAPELQLPIVVTLFDYEDQAKKLEDVDTLRGIVQALGRALKNAVKTPSWKKETEIRLINRIFINVFKVMGSHVGPWTELNSWLNCEFFEKFMELTEREALDVVLDVIESQNDGMLSSGNQLRYLKKLYHDCSVSGWQSRVHWNTVEGFNRSFILSSIDQDILTRNASTNDGTQVGLSYFEELRRDWNEALGSEYFSGDNFLFARMAEVLLHAMQSNAMTFDSQSPDFWRLIELFKPLDAVLLKYPFVGEEVRMAVVEKYANDPNRIDKAIAFMADLPKAVTYVGYKQLLSSMRENGHLHRPEIFRLAAIFMATGLRADAIWSEIPEQVQLISDYSTDKGLLWSVRAVNNTYEVYARQDDFFLSLKPVHSEAESGPHRVWIFDPVSTMKAGPTKVTIALADFLPPHFGGVVVASIEGVSFLRHVSGPRDRTNGRFAYFVPELSESLDSIMLFFNGDPIGILYDQEGMADGLGITSPPIPAEFVLLREE